MRTTIKIIVVMGLLFGVTLIPFAAGWISPAFTLRSVIELPAPLEPSWSTLTDFSRYPQWNPYLPKIEGDFETSSTLAVTLIDGNFDGPEVVMPTLTEIAPPNQFCWEGILVLPGIFDTRHCFVLQKINDESTRFEQFEEFNGLIPWLLAVEESLSVETNKAFAAMGLALQQRLQPSSQP